MTWDRMQAVVEGQKGGAAELGADIHFTPWREGPIDGATFRPQQKRPH
jgi:hypothetical protein